MDVDVLVPYCVDTLAVRPRIVISYTIWRSDLTAYDPEYMYVCSAEESPQFVSAVQ